jgi:beta-glucosidase-like glycosyl hydrolase
MWRFQVLGAGVAQLMPAYSSLQSPGSPTGPPDCANPYILQNILRQRFGAENISVISDNGGIAMVYQTHKCEGVVPSCFRWWPRVVIPLVPLADVPTALLAASISMNATTDLDLGYDAMYVNNLPTAVQQGLVQEATIEAAVRRSFRLRMRLGDFDPPR